jgi:hypothetical protein
MNRLLLCGLLLMALAGCSGNYKYSDDEYRPLGDPQVTNRDN